mgnify:CR=1 FL=1
MTEALGDLLRNVGDDLLRLLGIAVRVGLIVGIAWLIVWLARRQIEPMLARRAFGRNGALLIGRLLSIAAVVGALLGILATFGANWTGLLAFLSAFTVAIGLAIQDVLKNFVAGLLLLVERPFRVGDRIRVRDIEGEVQGIDIRTTLVRSSEGALVLVPNAILFAEVLTNRSHYRTRRLDLIITARSLDVAEIEKRLVATLAGIDGVRKPIPAPTIRQRTGDGTALEISILIESDPDVERAVMRALVEALGDSTIERRT